MSPLKDLLVKFVDHFFGKKAFDSVEVMQKILAQMRGCENLEKIFARMLQELQIVLEFDSYYLAVEGIKENSHLESEEIKSALQRFPVEDLPKEHNDIDAAIDHFKEKKEPAKLQLAQSLKLAGIRNYFILQDEKKSYGFLLLGAKKTRVPFSEAELNLVNGICHEAPYIIENLKMINKLLQQSRSLQEIEWAKTMLEAIAVKDELLEIGALKVIHFTSLSSEIKGDLIDYSKNNGRSSVGVYDAFHHGIQAVLTLNILFSVFRTSKDADSRFIMANQILRNFSEQKLCSAATLLAADQRNLELAIAGNPAPIIIAGSATRQIQMPESEPLGLAKNLKYSKLEHELQPGEIMLVATNGLFKAFTGIVGTDLPEFLQNHHFSSARDCREKILQKIGFKAMTKFSDDITFVLVS
jgi:serine phosphatase RsbU (regulator of sigma subunit)